MTKRNPDWLCPNTLEWVASQIDKEYQGGQEIVERLEEEGRDRGHLRDSTLLVGWKWAQSLRWRYRKRFRNIATRVTRGT